MTFIVNLDCPQCGQILELQANIDRMTCPHCKTEFFVKNIEGIFSLVPADPVASEQAMQKLKQEIADLSKIILETKIHEGYKKNIYYEISLVVSVLFSLSSFWAWRQYAVTIWIVFFVAGILIAIISIIAVRLQSMEYKEQTRKLEEMINPYQVALERKQKELSCYEAVTNAGEAKNDQ